MSNRSNNILFFVILIIIIICIVAYDNYVSKIEINKLHNILNSQNSQNYPTSTTSYAIHSYQPTQSTQPTRSTQSTQPTRSTQLNQLDQLDQLNQLDQSDQSDQYYSMQQPQLRRMPIQAPPPLTLLKDYDYRAYADPLTPPFKRDDYMIPAQAFYPNGFDYYTRGEPGMFKKVGYLKNLNETNQRHEFLTLMGRQKYMGSTQYEYYVTSTNSEQNLKFYLDAYKKELYEGDSVYVSQLKSNYEVFIDKNLDFEYSSRIY
jgi:hypothetical protein